MIMNNEADSAHIDSVQVLEWQNDSESKSLNSTSVGLGEGQTEGVQNFPVMLFESPADGAAGPIETNLDRLI